MNIYRGLVAIGLLVTAALAVVGVLMIWTDWVINVGMWRIALSPIAVVVYILLGCVFTRAAKRPEDPQ